MPFRKSCFVLRAVFHIVNIRFKIDLVIIKVIVYVLNNVFTGMCSIFWNSYVKVRNQNHNFRFFFIMQAKNFTATPSILKILLSSYIHPSIHLSIFCDTHPIQSTSEPLKPIVSNTEYEAGHTLYRMPVHQELQCSHIRKLA